MNIVVDANIIIMGLMGSRATLVILTSQQHSFYAPAKIVREIRKYRALIFEKMNTTPGEFEEYLWALLQFITILEPQEYEEYISQAKITLEQRDNADVDYLACALAIRADFIWTQDTDFTAQNLIPIKNTAQFIEDQKR